MKRYDVTLYYVSYGTIYMANIPAESPDEAYDEAVERSYNRSIRYHDTEEVDYEVEELPTTEITPNLEE